MLFWARYSESSMSGGGRESDVTSCPLQTRPTCLRKIAMSPTKLLSVGVVGAPGMVGRAFIKILEERRFPVEELRLFASQDSKGIKLGFRGRQIEVQTLFDSCFK